MTWFERNIASWIGFETTASGSFGTDNLRSTIVNFVTFYLKMSHYISATGLNKKILNIKESSSEILNT